MNFLNLNIAEMKKPLFKNAPQRIRVPKLQGLSSAIKRVSSRIHSGSRSIERFLILFAALSGGWFMFFDVYPPSDFLGSFAVKSIFWQAIFFSSITVHLLAVYFESCTWRIIACLYHATIWFVWILLAITATLPTMATPFLTGLFAMSFYQAVVVKCGK